MPTTTNLSLVTPASSDYVTNGAVAMQTLANGIDAYFGSLALYTPTLGNVTGGTVAGRYVRMGKLGFVLMSITAGTATANGVITISLPSGWTAASTSAQPIHASYSGVTYAYVNGPVSVVSITKTATGTAFTAGDSVANTRVNGWFWLA